MVFLLNYLPVIIVLIQCWYLYGVIFANDTTLMFKAKRVGFSTILAVIIVLGLQAATPHYMPKQKFVRQAPPPMEVVDGSISDIQPKPMSGEDRDARREAEYKKRIQFVVEQQEGLDAD